MPNFRCNMLDENGDTLFPADIVAETLDAAIIRAAHILNTTNHGPWPVRQVYAFEVWSDSGRVFPEPLEPAGPGKHRRRLNPGLGIGKNNWLG
jgi:hypothetical protein